jgi:hypothetical protein
MAFLNEEFDASTVEVSNNYGPVPAGWYRAKVVDADLKDTKAGNGQYIAVRYDITGPSHEGRVVWGNLNIKNPNPKAEEIGRQQLAELMGAIGLKKVSDTDQLIGGELEIKLAVRQSEQYGDSNDVKGYKSLTGSPPPAASKPSAASEQASSGSKAPWQK